MPFTANGLVIGIGFIGVIVSAFIRVIIQVEDFYIFINEIFDFVVYVIIFVESKIKPKCAK
ncbi:MAG: hypothetical protein ACFFAN_09960 [Promethearchaeota archaeon]